MYKKNSILKKSLIIGISILLLGPIIGQCAHNGIDQTAVEEIHSENALADTEVYNTTCDTMIHHDNPNKNDYGLRDRLNIRNEYGEGGSSGYAWDALIRFDISMIPSNAILISAYLHLYYFGWKDNNPSGRDLNLYRITSDWVEYNVSWNTQPSYAPQPTTYSTIPSSTDFWMEWNVSMDVQNFVSGNDTNYGWKITDENYWGDFGIPIINLYSKENGNYTPYLDITFYICGDANNDGSIDVGDIVYLINYLYKDGSEPIPYLCVGDANADGTVEVGDIVYLINYLFKGGNPPADNCCE